MNTPDPISPDPILIARSVALDLLDAVLRQRTPLDDALAANSDIEQLAVRDRGFARMLVATCLRRLGQIDALLAGLLTKPEPPPPALHDLLRLGVSQLLFMATPAHAAVDTTVALARLRGEERGTGLLNAVLRRVAREGEALLRLQDAARLNTPDWLWTSWRKAYGTPTARHIAEAHLKEAALDLTLRDPEQSADWAKRLEAMVMPTGSLRRPPGGGAVVELPGHGEGAWWVQDAAAALPARLLGSVVGQTVYDLCAAPGGKTAQLAAAGAKVTAVERSTKRMERLSANLARLSLNAETVTADAGQWCPKTPADAVLLDAPCSGTGTIRRHPDLARLKTADDVAKLVLVQDRLLDHAVTLVRPGGLLIYSVCSLEPEEGSRRIARLLDSGAPVARVPVKPGEIGGLVEAVSPNGDIRTLPCHLSREGGLDGFFIARLRRLG
ncbi:16S rRNA (cytosine967-C5)-methyltransferase [uncultured Gammaproteobacteria bacterium]